MHTRAARFTIPLSFVENGLKRIYSESKITNLSSINTGFANSIFSFTRDGIPLILRMPPRATPRLAYEGELMKTLRKKDLPVPTVFEYNSSYDNPLGHPFMIMERLKGKTFFEALDNQEIQPRSKLIEDISCALFRIHSVETNGLNVPEFSNLQSFLDQGISRIRELAKLSNTRSLSKFEEWYQKNRPPEKNFNKCLIHNDFHGYNIIVDGESLSGILDWNDAVIAEAQVDVAMFSLLASAAGYGPVTQAFMRHYRRVSGLSLSDISFYVTALALQKLLQIPLQKKQMEQTGQIKKAEVLSLVLSRIEKNLASIVEQGTGVSYINTE